MWGGQLSPAFKSIRLKAFGGWKFDRGTTKLHARILRGKGVQKKKPNMFTVGSSIYCRCGDTGRQLTKKDAVLSHEPCLGRNSNKTSH